LIIFALLLLTWAYQSVSYITLHDWPLAGVYEFFILLLEYVVLAALFQIGISSIYYFGPSNSKKWRFLSAGSITATVLGGISTIAFGLYVNNFNTYNKVYGSIGAIIALMILIYINILTIIVGFELNVSIEKAIAQRERRNAGKITQ
jgi:membrane protein